MEKPEFLSDMPENIQHAIGACILCAQTCEHLVQYCLKSNVEKQESVRQEQIRLIQDCAETCAFSSKFMLRNSTYSSYFAGLCEQVCNDCADVLDQWSNDDMVIKTAVDICRMCSHVCHEAFAGTGILYGLAEAREDEYGQMDADQGEMGSGPQQRLKAS